MKATRPLAMRSATGPGLQRLPHGAALAAEWQMPHKVQDGPWSPSQDAASLAEPQWLAAMTACWWWASPPFATVGWLWSLCAVCAATEESGVIAAEVTACSVWPPCAIGTIPMAIASPSRPRRTSVRVSKMESQRRMGGGGGIAQKVPAMPRIPYCRHKLLGKCPCRPRLAVELRGVEHVAAAALLFGRIKGCVCFA